MSAVWLLLSDPRPIRNVVGIEEGPRRARADREVYVLRQRADRIGNLDRVELPDDDADDVSRGVEDRPPAIAWLDRRGDLDHAAVVAGSGERADDSFRDADVRCEKPMQREAGHDDIVAGANAASTAKQRGFRGGLRALEQGEIISDVDAEHSQFAASECAAHPGSRGYQDNKDSK